MKFSNLPAFQTLFAILYFLVSLGIVPFAQAVEKKEIAVEIEQLPKDLWNKDRLVAKKSKSGVRLFDKGKGAFNDASFWQLKLKSSLPYGRKVLTFNLTVDEAHKPLWGKSILQPIIDGKEAKPGLIDNGKPSFDMIIADDGKGFIPKPSSQNPQPIVLQLSKSTTQIKTFAFMTAGAEGFNIIMSDFKVIAWPEKDDRIFPQNPTAPSVGFFPGQKQEIIIEWSGLENGTNAVTVDLKGPTSTEEIKVLLPLAPSENSGSFVSKLTLDLDPGDFTLAVPKLGARSEAASVNFSVLETNDALYEMRNDAWGLFHSITGGPKGRYPQAHLQDKTAKVFGTQETRDVTGGWYDAGDYGKYAVNGSWSVALMLLTGLHAPAALEHSISPLAGPSEKPDWMDVAGAQLDWLLKMQSANGGVNHKATTRDWPRLQTAPKDDKAVKFIMPVSSTATADFAATMALAAKVFVAHDAEKSKKFEQAAREALQWLDANPELVMIERTYEGKEYGGPYMETTTKTNAFLPVQPGLL